MNFLQKSPQKSIPIPDTLINIDFIPKNEVDKFLSLISESKLQVSEILEFSAQKVHQDFWTHANLILKMRQTNITDDFVKNFSWKEIYWDFSQINFITLKYLLSNIPQKEVREFHNFWNYKVQNYMLYLMQKYPWVKKWEYLRLLNFVKNGRIRNQEDLENFLISNKPEGTIKEKKITENTQDFYKNISFEDLKKELISQNILPPNTFYNKKIFGFTWINFIKYFLKFTLNITDQEKGYIKAISIVLLKIVKEEIFSLEETKEVFLKQLIEVQEKEIINSWKQSYKWKHISIKFENLEFNTWRQEVSDLLKNSTISEYHTHWSPFLRNISMYIKFYSSYKKSYVLKHINIALLKKILTTLFINEEIYNYHSYEELNTALIEKVNIIEK